MRKIRLSNSKQRDTELGFVAKPSKKTIKTVLKNGNDKIVTSILRSTMDTNLDSLVEKYGDNISDALINGDPEIDIEKVGMKLKKLNRIYVDKENKLVFRIKEIEITKNPKGEEIKRAPLKENYKLSNINTEDYPIKWTGKFIPKKVAVKMFVFSKHYQIHHVDGLSFDFLYNMATELEKKRSLMFVGAGKKGKEGIIITGGGTPYKGFLEGRIKGDTYLLILHLTNLEIKELIKEEE